MMSTALCPAMGIRHRDRGCRPRSALPLVLSVNSTIAIRRGLAPFPGELPIWVPLMVFTWMAAVLLLKAAQSS